MMGNPLEELMMNSTIELAVGSRTFRSYSENFEKLVRNFGKMVNVSDEWLERLKRGGAEIFVRSKFDQIEKIEDEEKREQEITRYASDLIEAAVYTGNKSVVSSVVKRTASALHKRRPDIALERAMYLLKSGYFDDAERLAGPYLKVGKYLRHL